MRIMQRLLLPLVLLLFGGMPALAQGAAWTVSEAKGVVTVIDAQGTRPASVGTRLAPGATVRTAARASAVLVRGKEFVTMRQNAQLRIAPAQRERGIVQILQDYGSALFNIGKQPNPHFGVETPYLAAVVKGTTFVITVTDEGASLQVTEGAVETSTLDGGAVELIRPGDVAMIAAADPLRMVIEGEGRKVMDSPARAAAPPAAAPSPAPTPSGPAPAPAAPPAAPALRPAAFDPAASVPDTSPRIDQAIVSTPQDLGQVSNGFASGEVVVLAAVVVAETVREEGGAGGGPGSGNGGAPGDGEVCAGSTCAPVGEGPGNGNGNAGGNGGSGNGNGGGNANAGDNGSGGAGQDEGGNGNGNGNGNGGGDVGGDDEGDDDGGKGNGGRDDDDGGRGNGGRDDDDGGDDRGGNGGKGKGDGNGGGNGRGGGRGGLALGLDAVLDNAAARA